MGLILPYPAEVDWSSTASPLVAVHRRVTVCLAGKDMGLLVAYHEKAEVFETLDTQEALESLALQIAAIASNPKPEIAIVLDRHMAQLQSENPNFDWCGVYRLEGDRLYLTAFRGAATPHAVIDSNSGICGAAVRENRSLNISDVSQDSRYLSCDSRTRSEAVVPIRNHKGEPIGEIDIDSHTPNAFGPAELERLEELSRELSPMMIE